MSAEARAASPTEPATELAQALQDLAAARASGQNRDGEIDALARAVAVLLREQRAVLDGVSEAFRRDRATNRRLDELARTVGALLEREERSG